MHRPSLSFSFLYFAVFCGFVVVEADIQCYLCFWASVPLPGFDTDPACKSAPPSKYLQTFPSHVDNLTEIQAIPEVYDLMSDTLATSADMKVNDTAQEITYSSPTKQQESKPQYTVLCATMTTLGLHHEGKPTQLLVRGPHPFRVPQEFKDKCFNSYEPVFKESSNENLTSNTFGKNVCFCGTNGCNKNPIEILRSGVKATDSSGAALISPFLLMYLTSTAYGLLYMMMKYCHN